MAEQRFDVVLMNPPFGDSTASASHSCLKCSGGNASTLVDASLPDSSRNSQKGGKLGVIANRTLLFAATLDEWRIARLSGVTAVVDLGHGVLDALVETAAFTLGSEAAETTFFVGALDSSAKDQHLAACIHRVQAGDTSSLR